MMYVPLIRPRCPQLLVVTALDQLRRLGLGPGDVLYLVLDDTQKRKRGKWMAAVSKIFLHAEKRQDLNL